MSPKRKFALALAVVTALFVVTAFSMLLVFRSALTPDQRAALSQMLDDRGGMLFVLSLLALFALYVALEIVFRAYVAPAVRLAEDLRVIQTVNPAHRAPPKGASEMKALARAVDSFANGYRALRGEVEVRIAEGNARVEAEKNRLAALMSDLTQGVLVCNSEGRILLYNTRAKLLLEEPSEGRGGIGTALVGLGRSVFAIMDKNLIVHALDTVRHKLAERASDVSAHLVTARPGGQLLRANMAPVLGPDGAVGGFVLTLDDVTRTVEVNSRRDALLESLTQGIRASLANIRAAIETMVEYPTMDEAHRGRFAAIINDEAENLSRRLEGTLAEHADALRMQWPLEDMLGADLLSAIRRRLESEPGVRVRVEAVDAPVWLSVDSYSVVQAMASVVAQAGADFKVRDFTLSLKPEGRYARIDLTWGSPTSDASVQDWESSLLESGGQGSSLKQVIERHGGEAWCMANRHLPRGTTFCLQLPTTVPARTVSVPVASESRPEYYDFDLFNQPGQRPELDDRLLSELSYTVFDTETTGLDPSQGDEIIAIGAARIVNGRLLKNESFDQLVDPRHELAPESIAIHGMTRDMLAGQPLIDEVLPAFARFVEDTVLVAHNAAFDMRFLQLKEKRTGIRFTQPVLDTLLLSAVAHPGYDPTEHTLEMIASRLGIDVIGRHTALGDAIVTGEILLKLIPLLAERGIRTLGEAREASRKTLYAKLEY